MTEGIELSGRTALVTGATSGLGRECARVLALRGARVLLAARNVEKGEATRAAFADEVGEAAASRCEVRRCDLASMRSVAALADELLTDGTTLDLLFLNGGVFSEPFRLTDEGLEYTFAANYLGHFLLVHRLASAAALAPSARIVATLSEGVSMNPLAKADIDMAVRAEQNAGRYSKLSASPSTKVLLALLAIEFSRRARDAGLDRVTFNGVLPKTTLTDNVNQAGPIGRAIFPALGKIFFAPVDVGATVLLWAATEPALAGRTGRVFSHRLEETALPKRASDPAMARRAWDETEARLGLPPWPR